MSGVFHAAILFLVAAGLQVVFGVQKIFNLACGSFYALGAYVGRLGRQAGHAAPAGRPRSSSLPLALGGLAGRRGRARRWSAGSSASSTTATRPSSSC